MSLSIHRRQLLVATLVVFAFLGATGVALDSAFRASALESQRGRLRGDVYTLLAAADVRDGQLHLPTGLPDPRFSSPGSGLYAVIENAAGERVWASPSMLGVELPIAGALPPGATRFQGGGGTGRGSMFVLGYGFSWQEASGRTTRFTAYVAEDAGAYNDQIAAFRGSLWGWLAAATAALLAAQAIALSWSLRPLRRVSRDVRAVETGALDALPDSYPREIQGLARNLNGLIHSERARGARYREALGNLAHSLKTPLAVLRGALEADSRDLAEAREQVQRIDRVVDYQLRRAATGGRTPLSSAVAIRPVAERLARALVRAHGDRRIDIRIASGREAVFPGSADDLMEILGNLMDNACKWARSQVVVAADRSASGERLFLTVSDDGPGVPPEVRDRITGRGVRLDQRVPGQGIGLAVTRELVEAYGGRLRIETADLGGARVSLEFPTTGIAV